MTDVIKRYLWQVTPTIGKTTAPRTSYEGNYIFLWASQEEIESLGNELRTFFDVNLNDDHLVDEVSFKKLDDKVRPNYAVWELDKFHEYLANIPKVGQEVFTTATNLYDKEGVNKGKIVHVNDNTLTLECGDFIFWYSLSTFKVNTYYNWK